MEQVKLFWLKENEETFADAEKFVNRWLAEQPRFRIVDRKMTLAFSDSARALQLVIAIFYETDRRADEVIPDEHP
jgi:hypothetical protein